MKRIILSTILLAVPAAAATPALIPQPVSLQTQPGAFRLHAAVTIVSPPGSPEARLAAAYLANAIAPPTGWHLKISEAAVPLLRRNAIVLGLTGPSPAAPQWLRTRRNHPRRPHPIRHPGRPVLRRADAPPTPAARYRKLHPPQHRLDHPRVRIVDYPRYDWRGLCSTSSRHFFTKHFVEQYIDRMARYKMNVFHWHLTDDNGWRIEIKGLAAAHPGRRMARSRLAKWGTREAPREGEQPPKAASTRRTISGKWSPTPANASSPCCPKSKCRATLWQPSPPTPKSPAPAARSTSTPAPTSIRKSTTPSAPATKKHSSSSTKSSPKSRRFSHQQFVHIGGDECFKGFWKTCAKCQRRMADEHLSTPEELQSYLVRRAEKILESKGKKLIGWDEILEGGLAPNAAVMSWRGMEGGIAAAKMNHQVVMTPTNFVYLDYYQGDPSLEPSTFNRLLLSNCYRFEPTPEGVDPKLILGGQGNLWTESVPTGQARRIYDLAAGPGPGGSLLVAKGKPQLGPIHQPRGITIPAVGCGAGELRAHHVRRSSGPRPRRRRQTRRAHDHRTERLRYLLHLRRHQPGPVHPEIRRRTRPHPRRCIGSQSHRLASRPPLRPPPNALPEQVGQASWQPPGLSRRGAGVHAAVELPTDAFPHFIAAVGSRFCIASSIALTSGIAPFKLSANGFSMVALLRNCPSYQVWA